MTTPYKLNELNHAEDPAWRLWTDGQAAYRTINMV